MQRRLLLKLVSNFPTKLCNSTITSSSSLFHSKPYKTFASLTRTPQTRNQNPFLAHPLPQYSHSWRSLHGFSEKIHGFLSNPLLASQILAYSNTFLRVSRRGLSDSRLGFLKVQFPKQNFDYGSNFRTYRRGWYVFRSGF